MGDDDANYYKSLILILQWVVELERIDVAHEVQLLASYGCAPLERSYGSTPIGVFWEKHIKFKLILEDHKLPEIMEQIDCEDLDRGRYCELIPIFASYYFDNPARIRFSVDAEFEMDLVATVDSEHLSIRRTKKLGDTNPLTFVLRIAKRSKEKGVFRQPTAENTGNYELLSVRYPNSRTA